jgi:hypothetical protein
VKKEEEFLPQRRGRGGRKKENLNSFSLFFSFPSLLSLFSVVKILLTFAK